MAVQLPGEESLPQNLYETRYIATLFGDQSRIDAGQQGNPNYNAFYTSPNGPNGICHAHEVITDVLEKYSGRGQGDGPGKTPAAFDDWAKNHTPPSAGDRASGQQTLAAITKELNARLAAEWEGPGDFYPLTEKQVGKVLEANGYRFYDGKVDYIEKEDRQKMGNYTDPATGYKYRDGCVSYNDHSDPAKDHKKDGWTYNGVDDPDHHVKAQRYGQQRAASHEKANDQYAALVDKDALPTYDHGHADHSEHKSPSHGSGAQHRGGSGRHA